VERVFEINEHLELLGEEVGKFSIREMARQVIPNSLKHTAGLHFYDKGGEDLCDADEIIELCRKITASFKQEHNVSNNHSSNGGRNNRTSSNSGNSNSNTSRGSAPCRKHDGAHLWKDCPTTGATQTAAMPIQEMQAKPPTPILKVPAQGRELEGKSRVQRISDPPVDLQWSASTMTAKPTTNLHAAATPHVVN
jgi:hypothetical protein